MDVFKSRVSDAGVTVVYDYCMDCILLPIVTSMNNTADGVVSECQLFNIP